MRFMAKNEGKIFEDSFASSVDKSHILVKRLNDNAASWSGGNISRFASKNECDYILYDSDTKLFMALELKSTKRSLTFWRKDFEKKCKKQTFNITKYQIQGLQEWSQYSGVFGFVINFREYDNKTFFIDINDFLEYTNDLNKKSININDILKIKHIVIDNELKKIRYKYDIDKFIKDVMDKEETQ